MITKKRSREVFLDLAKIYSPSGKEAGVAEYIMDFFKVLGQRARRDRQGNVMAYVPGKGEPLMLCAHMDTLPSDEAIKPVEKNGEVRSSGNTILGADDKAGITSILCAAEHLITNNKPHRPLELVFTVEEETGHNGAINLNYKHIRSKEALLLDDCARPGRITLAAPYLYELEIEVRGRSTHVGAWPVKSINALLIASKAVGEISLGRINKSTTINLGQIEGGTDASRVPGKISIKGEVRSLKQETALDHVDKINRVFKKYVRRYRGRLYFRSRLIFKGYEHKKTDGLLKSIAMLNKDFGFSSVYQRPAFITDANIFNAKGIKTLNISYGGFGEHTNKERIKVEELQQMAEFLTVFSLI